jgi:hypothetical protein
MRRSGRSGDSGGVAGSLQEFIVQGPEVDSDAFLRTLEGRETVEIKEIVAPDVVVLNMTEADREVLASTFRTLLIEPNRPLQQL